MILQKWNYKKRKYEDFNSPAKNPVLVEYDLKELIDCAECGKKVMFGLTFSSRKIHTRIGLGLAVCEKCYEKELKELMRKNYETKNL